MPLPATDGGPSAVQTPAGIKTMISPAEREELKREIRDEVVRELEGTYPAQEADARNYDAATLKELQQSVNLLQIHGYYRVRGDLFVNPTLSRGQDAANMYLFPYVDAVSNGTNTLGVGDMRLRVEPVLRVSDWLTIHSQMDILNNVTFGGNPELEPFYPGTVGTNGNAIASPTVYANYIQAQSIDVERVWAEVKLPIGQLAFGRMGFHWGEGMFYNDGNCLDCDFGNTFDRLLLSSEVLGHVLTFTWDMLGVGQLTPTMVTQSYGTAFPIQQIASSYRFAFHIQRILKDEDRRRRLENNSWAVQYGLMGAYRFQGYETVPEPGGLYPSLQKINASFGEGDIYLRAEYQKLKLAFEGAIFGGEQGNRLATDPNGNEFAVQGSDLTYIQGALLGRARQYFLKQDSLFIGADLGWASGDKQPGMGIRTWAQGSQANGATVRGDIDGPKYDCPAATSPTAPVQPCLNNDITNFVMNPDFHIDEFMWRYIFTSISGAYFGRVMIGFKPGGRASGGSDDYGLDLNFNVVYSQAVYASETPNGYHTPLGVELDPSAIYTTKDGLIVGASAGFLIPLAGLDNVRDNQSSSLGEIFRGFLAVRF